MFELFFPVVGRFGPFFCPRTQKFDLLTHVFIDLDQLSSKSDGGHVLSVTLPGLQHCDVEVGVWSQDPSYPSTHVVVRLDGVVARIELNSTLRRCVALEAVVAGDSIAVSFRADPGQWPDPRASRGASDQTGESGKEG